jgi:hypothetical protein
MVAELYQPCDFLSYRRSEVFFSSISCNSTSLQRSHRDTFTCKAAILFKRQTLANVLAYLPLRFCKPIAFLDHNTYRTWVRQHLLILWSTKFESTSFASRLQPTTMAASIRRRGRDISKVNMSAGSATRGRATQLWRWCRRCYFVACCPC